MLQKAYVTIIWYINFGNIAKTKVPKQSQQSKWYKREACKGSLIQNMYMILESVYFYGQSTLWKSQVWNWLKGYLG
jgi:hypothetical protein